MNKNIYAGLVSGPSTDFSGVRDGRTSPPFYIDVDLSTARRDTLTGNALIVNASGNSFYIDANPSDGNAFVEFQDTAFDSANAPLYVSPGVIFKLPFTQFKLTNSAQPGKRIRIVYGIDLDFLPGSVSQIVIAGTLPTEYKKATLEGRARAGRLPTFAISTATPNFFGLYNNTAKNFVIEQWDFDVLTTAGFTGGISTLKLTSVPGTIAAYLAEPLTGVQANDVTFQSTTTVTGATATYKDFWFDTVKKYPVFSQPFMLAPGKFLSIGIQTFNGNMISNVNGYFEP